MYLVYIVNNILETPKGGNHNLSAVPEINYWVGRFKFFEQPLQFFFFEGKMKITLKKG